jgi:hypothetical protein
LTQLVDTKQQEASHADAGFRVWILFSSVFFRNTGKNTRALFCFAFSRAFQVRALSEASLVSLSSLHTRTASQARFIFQRTKRNEKERKGTKRNEKEGKGRSAFVLMNTNLASVRTIFPGIKRNRKETSE